MKQQFIHTFTHLIFGCFQYFLAICTFFNIIRILPANICFCLMNLSNLHLKNWIKNNFHYLSKKGLIWLNECDAMVDPERLGTKKKLKCATRHNKKISWVSKPLLFIKLWFDQSPVKTGISVQSLSEQSHFGLVVQSLPVIGFSIVCFPLLPWSAIKNG